MQSSRIKLVAGPDHPITIEPTVGRVVVTLNGETVADTQAALTLHEATYSPVQYIPRSDVDMSLFERTDYTTYCPYKGDSSYFTLKIDGSRRNGVWSYEDPFEQVGVIKEYLAFYLDGVDSIEVHTP